MEQFYSVLIEIRNEVAGLKTEVDGLKTTLTEVKDDLAGVKSNVQELTDKTNRIETDFKSLNDGLDNRINDITKVHIGNSNAKSSSIASSKYL